MAQASLKAPPGSHLSRRIATLGALAVLCVVLAYYAPSMFTTGNVRAIVLSSSVLLIAAIGATFVILMGSIDFSIGAIATFCGMLVAWLAPELGLWAVLLASVVGLFFGIVNGLIYVYLRIPSILVTLGTATTLSGAVLFISDGRSLPVSDPSVIYLAQGSMLFGIPNAVLLSVLVFAIFLIVGSRTRFGRMTLAIGSDEQTATLVGVKVSVVKIQAFAVSGLLGGFAGSLLAARLGTSTATIGSYMTLDTITAVVVGGTAITGGSGAVRLTILGVLFIAILSNAMNILAFPPYLQTIIQGIVIVLAVLLNSPRMHSEDVK
jgi:ribose transport system permease protein